MMYLDPCDVVVASSRSGHIALERLFTASEEKIRTRFGKTEHPISLPKIVTIPFGVEIPPDDLLNSTQARKFLGIPLKRFMVLYLGRLSEEYKADLEPLLQAMRQLVLTGCNAGLILAGQALDPIYNLHLRSRIASLGLEKRTINLDNFPEFLKSSIYAAADVFVSPSDSIQETFGLAILEAMSHGKPVVVPSWSGYKDLVVDGQTGFLLKTSWHREAADCISMLAQIKHPASAAHHLAQHTVIDAGELLEKLLCFTRNPELGQRMGEAGKRRAVDAFSWPYIVKQFTELWRDQAKQAKLIRRKADLRISLGDVFSHYVDSAISPQDLLCCIPGFELDDDLAIISKSYTAHEQEQCGRLIKITRNRPVSVGELQDVGFSMDCILWLVKKGIRRIIKCPGHPSGRA